MNFKNFLFVLVSLLISVSAFGQKQENISRLFSKSSIISSRAQEFADDIVALKLDENYLREIYKQKNYDISITLPISNEESVTMEMTQYAVLNEGFILRTSKGDTIKDYEPGLFYKGKIKGREGYATLNVFKDQVMGIIALKGIGNIDLVKMDKSKNDYVVYQDRKVKVEKNLKCDTQDDEIGHNDDRGVNTIKKRSDSGLCFYIEGDYALYLDKGSVQAATDYITALFAEVEVLYNEIDVDLGINEIMIWEEDDGYDQNDSNTALDQFRDNNPDPNGGLASLYALGGNNTGGLAWLDVLCQSGWNYAYMNIHSGYNSVPTYSWSVEVIAHEVGHNFGSRHTHACVWNGNDTQIDDCGPQAGYNEGSCYDSNNPILPDAGTIMSYCHLVAGIGIDFNLGFGDQPGNLISNNYGSASCVGDCESGAIAPVADFDADPDVVCEGDDVTFYDLSTNSPNEWSWTFDGGDPDESDEQEPYVTYYNAGIYDVTLEVTNSAGSNSKTETEYITVNAVALPSFTYEIINDNEVHFTNTSSLSTEYYWDFDDGDDSDEENPVHTYTEDGSYTVTLYSSNNECTDNEEFSTEIEIVTKVTAVMKMNHYEGCKIDTIHFFDVSSSNVNGRVWTFEAGIPASSTLKNPFIKYDSAGKFNVELIVYNSIYADTVKHIDTIYIHDKPVANFLPSINGNVVTFTNTTFDGNTYNWNYGDGSYSTDTNSVHTYSTGGMYNVTLIATNSCGKDTITKVINLTLEANADFTVDTAKGCAPFTANFHSLSNTTNISWVFEGGTPATSTMINPIISYSTPGVYDVTMYATNNLGSDTLKREEYIEVLAQPNGSFTSSVSGYDVNFVQATNNVISFNWDFGDGNVSTMENPTHTYSEDGTYNVKFKYSNLCDTLTENKDIVIANPPTASFTYGNVDGCESLTVQFTNTSSSNSDSYLWTFEGGTPATSTEENPVVEYSTKGVYDVSLKVTNSVGDNSKSEVDLVHVKGKPLPDFTTTSNELEYTFNYTGETANSVTWNFGDGGSGNGNQVVHTFAQEGDYTIVVTAKNNCGEETMEKIISVATKATAMFNLIPKEGCAPLVVNFTNLSSSTNSILWEFEGGNPKFSTENGPEVKYILGGNYFVQLIAYGNNGNDTMRTESAVVVDAGPAVDYSYTKSSGTVSFTSECSDDANKFYWDFGDGILSEEKNPVHTYSSTGSYKVTLYSNNDCGQQSISKTIDVKVTSVVELFLDKVKLYPNPNDGNFSLSIGAKDSGYYKISIYNMSGKLLDKRSVRLSSGNNTIKYSIDSFKSGNYILSISDNDRKYDMLFNVK